jgi:hypothetical protein
MTGEGMGNSEAEGEVEEVAGVGSMGEEVGGIGTIIMVGIETEIITMEVEDGGIETEIITMEVEDGVTGIVITITTIVEVGAIETTTTTGTTETTTTLTTTTIAPTVLQTINPINVQTVSTTQAAAAPTVQDPHVDHPPALSNNNTNPRKRHNSSV